MRERHTQQHEPRQNLDIITLSSVSQTGKDKDDIAYVELKRKTMNKLNKIEKES